MALQVENTLTYMYCVYEGISALQDEEHYLAFQRVVRSHIEFLRADTERKRCDIGYPKRELGRGKRNAIARICKRDVALTPEAIEYSVKELYYSDHDQFVIAVQGGRTVTIAISMDPVVVELCID